MPELCREDSASEDIDEYVRTMPAPYDSVFQRLEIEEHFRIVSDRAGQAAHMALWRKLKKGGAAVCIVADDQPGLLWLITRAFDRHDLDVISAQIYCRRRADGTSEAVDFFWLKRLGGDPTLSAEDIARANVTLNELVRTEHDTERPRPRISTIPAAPQRAAEVYFDPVALAVGESVLVVEARDRPGLLFAITSELHRLAVEIVASNVRTEAGRAIDRFTLTCEDGRPLTGARLDEVQRGVAMAVSAGPAAVRQVVEH